MLYLLSSWFTLIPLTNHEKVEFRVVSMVQVRLRGAPTLTVEEAGVTVMVGESDRRRKREKKWLYFVVDELIKKCRGI